MCNLHFPGQESHRVVMVLNPLMIMIIVVDLFRDLIYYIGTVILMVTWKLSLNMKCNVVLSLQGVCSSLFLLSFLSSFFRFPVPL